MGFHSAFKGLNYVAGNGMVKVNDALGRVSRGNNRSPFNIFPNLIFLTKIRKGWG
jgi:hypothetical protein